MIKGEWQLEGDGITGWAKSSDLEQPLWLELLADGEVMGIGCANLPEPNNCGFWLPLPAAALEDDADLQVRALNTNTLLEKKTEARSDDPEESSLTGELYIDRGLTISGWALDPSRSDQKLRLSALVGSQKVGEAIAGERRYRPIIADGHGFSMELPETLADGKSYVVHIQDDKGRQMPGSPFRIRTLPDRAGKWLTAQKKIDKPLIELISGLLENMEERLPGLIGQGKYTAWKKAFPAPLAQGRPKIALSLISGPARLLASQQGCDIKLRDSGADYALFAHDASALHPQAIAQMAAVLRQENCAAVYADGETASGLPLFKPAWDREAFLATDYLGTVLATTAAVKAAGITPEDSPTVAKLKLAFNANDNIRHLPLPLYVAEEQISDTGRSEAITHWLEGHYPGSSYENGRVRYAINSHPRISIIIPTRDHGDLLKVCLDSLAKTAWPDYELIILDNGSVEDDALTVMSQAESRENVCILRRPGLFNYSSLNNEAAKYAKGEFICLLNNDTEVINPEWLTELAALLLMAGDKAGAAGAKLLWPNGLVQHGGVIIGIHQLAGHVGNLWLADEPGYMGRNLFTQQYSAVTAACMLTPRKLFLDSGGLDSRKFPIAFNDVDYCLRLRAMGKKIFWTPHSLLCHHESASRGKDVAESAKKRSDREMRTFRKDWGHYEDPFYNPNLPLSAAAEPFYGLAFPPRPRIAR